MEVRTETKNLIALEIRFSNILWVLRLKVYYKMNAEEIISRLFFAELSKGKDDILAGEAVKLLNKDTSSFDDWKNWKYKACLNPNVEGQDWELDPRWVEKALMEGVEIKLK